MYIVFPSWPCRNMVRKKRAGWSSCAKFQRGRSHRDISQIILGFNPHEPLSSFIGWLHYNLVLSGMKKKRMLDHTPLPTKKGKTLTHNCSGGHWSPHVFQTHGVINSSILFPMRFYFFFMNGNIVQMKGKHPLIFVQWPRIEYCVSGYWTFLSSHILDSWNSLCSIPWAIYTAVLYFLVIF